MNVAAAGFSACNVWIKVCYIFAVLKQWFLQESETGADHTVVLIYYYACTDLEVFVGPASESVLLNDLPRRVLSQLTLSCHLLLQLLLSLLSGSWSRRRSSTWSWLPAAWGRHLQSTGCVCCCFVCPMSPTHVLSAELRAYKRLPHTAHTKLVAWHSGRTSVSDWRTFPVLRSTCS